MVQMSRQRQKEEEEREDNSKSDDADLLIDKEFEFPGFEDGDGKSGGLRRTTPIIGRTALHSAAARGDVEQVQRILSHKKKNIILHAKDENDWQAIHEAGRGGHIDTVK